MQANPDYPYVPCDGMQGGENCVGCPVAEGWAKNCFTCAELVHNLYVRKGWKHGHPVDLSLSEVSAAVQYDAISDIDCEPADGDVYGRIDPPFPKGQCTGIDPKGGA